MKKSDLNLTSDQLTVYLTLHKIRQAWLTLAVILFLFAGGFFVFLYAVVCIRQETIAKSVTGGIDALLAFSIRAIVGHLFPRPK